MKVTVVLMGWLESARGKRIEMELPEGACIADAIAATPVDREDVDFAATILNTEQADPSHQLSDGDRLYIFPPLAGG